MKKKNFQKRMQTLLLATCLSTSMLVPSIPTFAADATSQTAYKDGTYEGSGSGFGGKVTLRVTIQNGKITSISEVSQSETSSYWKEAKTLFSTIIEKQSAEVDTITGATKSCDAIKEAVRQALNSASSATNTPDSSIFASGKGTTKSPFLIQTATQFKNFAKSVTGSIDYTGYTVKLANNIDISGSDWNPIGGSSTKFNGIFDGAGYTINGLKEGTSKTPRVLDKTNTYIGLFGKLGAKAIIKNINLSNVNINVSYPELLYVGGIAATTTGSGDGRTGTQINGCRVNGNIKVQNERGNIWTGGLVGMQFRGSILNSVSNVNVSASETTDTSWGKTDEEYWVEVGGISGLNFWGLIANSYATGDCYAKFEDANDPDASYAAVGGLAGLECGDELNNYATGNVTSDKKTKYIGSLQGLVEGNAQIKNNWYNNTSQIKNADSISKANNTNIMVCKEGDAVIADNNSGFNPSKDSSVIKSLNKIAKAPTIDLSRYGISSSDLDSWRYSTIQKAPVQIHSGNPMKKIAISKCKISGITNKIYTGKSVTQKPKVTYNGQNATFTLSYKNRKDIGTQTVEIKGNNDFSGTKNVSYKILPGKAKVKKASISKKTLTITYKKVKGVKNYQVAVKKGSGKWKTYSVTGIKKKIRKTSTRKKYKVKVRAYKKVKGKKYYGDWSKTVSAK